MTLPFDTRCMQCPGGSIWVDHARIPEPDCNLLNPLNPRYAVEPVSHGGRQAAWFVQAGFGDAVIRHYRRGGLVARFSADRYIWRGPERTRSLAEYRLLQFMYERGLPVPRPLAAAYWRTGLLYRAAIMIERIPDARPLVTVLDQGHQARTALALFQMHQLGVWHADLNAYNILIDNNDKVWLIDFDKSRPRALTPELRQANLLRLRRSLVKLAGERGMLWWAELDQAYGQLERSHGHL